MKKWFIACCAVLRIIKLGFAIRLMKRLRRRLACSKRKAIACVEILVKTGIIRKEERATKNGGNRTNVYYPHEEKRGTLEKLLVGAEFSKVQRDIAFDAKNSTDSESDAQSNAPCLPCDVSPAYNNALC